MHVAPPRHDYGRVRMAAPVDRRDDDDDDARESFARETDRR